MDTAASNVLDLLYEDTATPNEIHQAVTKWQAAYLTEHGTKAGTFDDTPLDAFAREIDLTDMDAHTTIGDSTGFGYVGRLFVEWTDEGFTFTELFDTCDETRGLYEHAADQRLVMGA